MSEKIYLNFLILCGILSPGIIGTFFEENNEESSDLYSRKKRAINVAPEEHRELSSTDVTYIVEVIKNGVRICAGIIVSPEHILTIKECVSKPAEEYTVKSGHLFIHTIQNHSVIDKVVVGNLALLSITPLIIVESPSPNRSIKLYEGPVEALTLATISSFATNSEGNEPPIFRQLTQVQVVRLNLCSDYYKHHSRVLTKENICALESSRETGFTAKDRGSALVLDGKLVGVLVYPGNIISYASPDVFLRVNHENIYNRWIKSHIEPYLPIEVNVEHPHNGSSQTHAPQTHTPYPNASPNYTPYPNASPNYTPYPNASPYQSPYPHASSNQSPYPHASPYHFTHSHTSPNYSPHPHTSKSYSPHPHTSQSYSPHSNTSKNPSPSQSYSPHSNTSKNPSPHSNTSQNPSSSSSASGSSSAASSPSNSVREE